MLRIAVMVSGGGTNLQAIIDGVKDKTITNTQIAAVISNNANAYALTRAKENGIPAYCVSPKDYATRDEFNKALLEKVKMCIRDSCGTKVKLAFIMDKHDTIGIDAVAMCVNDVVCAGGEPLFFLDYIACGKNYPEKIATIVGGVAEGCRQSECALIGGETAEHPGLMPVDEYDVAGFAVGVVDRKDLITGENLSLIHI